jgi:hypothetical protein
MNGWSVNKRIWVQARIDQAAKHISEEKKSCFNEENGPEVRYLAPVTGRDARSKAAAKTQAVIEASGSLDRIPKRSGVKLPWERRYKRKAFLRRHRRKA